MALVALVALCASAAFVTVTAVFAVVHGLRAWRRFRGFTEALGDALAHLAERAQATERRATEVTDGAARLTEAVGRLRIGLDRLALLRAATGDAQALFGLRALVPRK